MNGPAVTADPGYDRDYDMAKANLLMRVPKSLTAAQAGVDAHDSASRKRAASTIA